jgi:hypothetical protein
MKTLPLLLSLLLVVVGGALLIWGMTSTSALAPSAFEGVPTYKSVFVVMVGAILAILGIVRLQRTT